MRSHLVILLIAITIALISAKTVYQIDGPEEQRDMIDDYNRFEELLKFIQYEKNHQRDYERYLQKRAKAIVKGDPREFMG